MRKFISLLAVALLMVCAASCTSCTNDTPWGIEYALNSDGQTDGSVCVTFVNGEFNIHGDANYQFEWSSTPIDSTKAPVFKTEAAKPLNEALACSDMKTLEAAEYVDNWLDKSIGIKSFEGHYDIYVKGYVKETKTQITFSIDRHFTNIEESDIDPE